MAFSAALIYIILGLVLAIHAVKPFQGLIKTGIKAVLIVIALFALIECLFNMQGSHFIVETWLLQAGTIILASPLSYISPISAALVIPASIALILMLNISDPSNLHKKTLNAIGIIGVVIFLVSFTFFLSYIYDNPFLYDTPILPVAPGSVLALLFFSVGLVTLSGPTAIPLIYFSGPSTNARLLRVFIPLVIIIIFLQNYLEMTIFSIYKFNMAILVAVFFVGVAIVTTFVVIRASRSIGDAIDSAEQKRIMAEIALKESEERFRSFVENANDIVYSLTPDGIFTYVSPYWTEVLGHRSDEVIGQSIKVFVHPDDLYHIREFLRQTILKEKKISGVEYRVQHKDGTWQWHTTNATIMHDSEGKIVSLMGIARNITQRKQTELALHDANKKLNLLSHITRHDIKNQLTALMAYIELCKDSLNNPEELAEYIGKQQQIADLIDSQINFTRYYEEIGMKDPLWQNFSELIRESATTLPMRNILVDVDRNDLEIFADPLFKKVFYNLIDNSLRYGGNKMTIIRVSSSTSENELTIVCEDDGAGISDDDKKRLFTRGFGRNTGFGLYLSREILAITGITITENGTPGKGARFEIIVPKRMWQFRDIGQN
ncbi:MAG: PAS domain-containing sensor histidine kinase [Methanoregula sp.]|nr:PAS domain-containing sensor histidine kinase [Methanoregula sp.]